MFKIEKIFESNFNETRTFWQEDLWTLINGDMRALSWKDFYKNYCEYYKIYLDYASNDYNCLKFAFVSFKVVSQESFKSAFYWLSDSLAPTWGFIKTIIENVQYNWFWAIANTELEKQLLKHKKEFVVRYSVKLNAFVISFKKPRSKISHIKVDNPYILKKKSERNTKETYPKTN